MNRGPGRPRIPADIRFWAKTLKTDSCWNWTDAPTRQGYGRIRVGESKLLAHRYSWELHGLEPLDSRPLDHICHNTMCVNPSHLRIVTPSQNSQNFAGAQRRNQTGERGVTVVEVKTKRGRPFLVHATLDGVTHYGGRFYTIAEAAEAAKQLRLSLFTHNEVDRKAA